MSSKDLYIEKLMYGCVELKFYVRVILYTDPPQSRQLLIADLHNIAII